MEVIKRSGAREKLDLLKIRTVLENALSLLKEWKTTKDVSTQDTQEWTIEDLNNINIERQRRVSELGNSHSHPEEERNAYSTLERCNRISTLMNIHSLSIALRTAYSTL